MSQKDTTQSMKTIFGGTDDGDDVEENVE